VIQESPETRAGRLGAHDAVLDADPSDSLRHLLVAEDDRHRSTNSGLA